MTDNRTLALAKRIKEETMKNKLFWVRSSDPNTYRLSLGSGLIMLSFDPSRIITPYYTFSVYNEKNTVIDEIKATPNEQDNWNLLKEIYERAESSFLKKDETYKSMFDALDLPF